MNTLTSHHSKTEKKLRNEEKDEPHQKSLKTIFPYIIGGIIWASLLYYFQPTLRAPFFFFFFLGALLILSIYLLFFRTFSFYVGRMPVMVVDEEKKDRFHSVKRRVSDKKKLLQLPGHLKTIHLVGLGWLWLASFIVCYLLIT